jgi:hypothetical protein
MMNKWTIHACTLIGALALAACGGSQDHGGGKATSTAEAGKKKATVARPAPDADDNIWGVYLADQGKVYADDIGMNPFIYVIPAADNDMAEERRKNETDSIAHGAGSILIPGALLILGGPDARVTNRFVESLSKEVKPDALKGVTVLIVGDASQKDLLTKTLAPTGARVRVATM